MSAVLDPQVSEGYPVDGRVFEPPQINRDNETPRYVTFIGSLVDPEIARSRPWTKAGGIEITNPCLRYVKNFIRKGRITPILKDTHDFQPFNRIEKTLDTSPFNAGYFPQPIPKGYVPPALPAASGEHHHGFGEIAVGGPSPYGNLVGRLALPGEQINGILTGPENLTQTNIQRGIVELDVLRGQPFQPQQIGDFYVDSTLWQIQKTIFPDYPNFLNIDGQATVLLDDIELLLDTASEHLSLRAIVDAMHESLIQFRDYANATIQNVHHSMRESAGRGGYVFRYTAMDVVMLEQLGVARQDREIRQTAKATGNERLEGMFEQWLAIQIEEKQANVDREKRLAAMGIDANTMAAAPITNATPLGQEQMAVAMADTIDPLQCECGKVFDSAGGLKVHKNQWCDLNKVSETTEG